MIKVLYGSEPYLISKIKDEVVSQIQFPDMNLTSAEVFNSEIVDILQTYPLMEDRRVVVIDADSLSVISNDDFTGYMENPSEYSDLLVILRQADMRVKLVNQLKKNGLLTICNKFESEKDLIAEIKSVLSVNGYSIAEDAFKEFLKRENYFDNEDVTLYGVINDILGLGVVNPNITLDMVKSTIKDNAKENVFSLAKLILNKDVKGFRQQANLMSADQAIPTLSLIMREYRIAYKALYFKPNEIGAKYINFSSMTKEQLIKGIEVCMDLIDGIKQGRVDASIALNLASARLFQ